MSSPMHKSFGETIREAREKLGLPLREVAAKLDIDTSTLGKIERGERNANREMISLLSEILKIKKENLSIIFLSDVVVKSLYNEENITEIMKVAEEKMNNLKFFLQKEKNKLTD